MSRSLFGRRSFAFFQKSLGTQKAQKPIGECEGRFSFREDFLGGMASAYSAVAM
jgi:hypothetical protein